MESNKFVELSAVNVNEWVERKGKFNYLSWADAVAELLKRDPGATWEYKDPTYFAETLMVYCSVTAFGKTMTAQLPVMTGNNKPIPNPDAFAVNTAMQRCLAKAIALHGLGLYIYRGEDIPDAEEVDLTAESELWISSINDCKTIDELKSIYGKAYSALSKDKLAVEKIAKAKDQRKGELA